MPTTYTSAKLVRGKVSRFTLTDACGFPQITNSMYTTDGLIEVNSTKNMDTGDEIKTRRMTGAVGIYERGRNTLLDFTVDIHFEGIDPGVLTMLTGDALVLDAVGSKAVGWTERQGRLLTQCFALEVWTDSSGGACVAGTSKLYGYMLYPCIENGYITLDNVTDKEVTGTIHGNSRGGPSWGKGPYGATGDGSSVTGPVVGVGGSLPARLAQVVAADEHRHFELTPIAPPVAQAANGPQSITLPTTY